MGIDVLNLIRIPAGLLQGYIDGSDSVGAFRHRGRNMITVICHSETENLAIDLSAASPGVLKLFQDQGAASFTHQESIPVEGKGA